MSVSTCIYSDIMEWNGKCPISITKRGNSEHGTIHLPVEVNIKKGIYNVLVSDSNVSTVVSTVVDTLPKKDLVDFILQLTQKQDWDSALEFILTKLEEWK